MAVAREAISCRPVQPTHTLQTVPITEGRDALRLCRACQGVSRRNDVTPETDCKYVGGREKQGVGTVRSAV